MTSVRMFERCVYEVVGRTGALIEVRKKSPEG